MKTNFESSVSVYQNLQNPYILPQNLHPPFSFNYFCLQWGTNEHANGFYWFTVLNPIGRWKVFSRKHEDIFLLIQYTFSSCASISSLSLAVAWSWKLTPVVLQALHPLGSMAVLRTGWIWALEYMHQLKSWRKIFQVKLI